LEAGTQTENDSTYKMLTNYTTEEIRQALTDFESKKGSQQTEISHMGQSGLALRTVIETPWTARELILFN